MKEPKRDVSQLSLADNADVIERISQQHLSDYTGGLGLTIGFGSHPIERSGSAIDAALFGATAGTDSPIYPSDVAFAQQVSSLLGSLTGGLLHIQVTGTRDELSLLFPPR